MSQQMKVTMIFLRMCHVIFNMIDYPGGAGGPINIPPLLFRARIR